MSPEQWPRVKEIFHAALDRTADKRASFLESACGADVALRAEVDRLLEAHDQAGAFIEQSPIPQEPRLTGRVLGRYEVGRLIGRGGMGEVYAARDTELGRQVALKIGSDRDHASEAGLRREAQHASRLNHPHICTIHEVGAADGQTFIAMEYVDGERLSQIIPPEGFEDARVLRYGIQIADGLDHAHREGVNHRDLKTENIVITTDGRAKILDFGLARPLEPQRIRALSQSDAALDTVPADGLAGTLTSMAPEVLSGEPADERSDIWALGVLLYEMAAGRRPFTGATGFQVSGAILHQPPAPMPGRVSPALQAVIRRCLAKDPRERYRHAGEIRSALEAIQASASLPHSPATPAAAASGPVWVKSLRSRRVTVGAMGLLIAVIAGAIIIWQRVQPAEASLAVGSSGRPAIAVMAFENVIGNEDTAWMSRGVPNMLLTGLAQTRGLDMVSPQRLLEIAKQAGWPDLESLDQSEVVDIARRAGAGAIVRGTIVRAGADIRIDAQLEDLSTGRVLAADSVRGTDVFALVDQLAERIRNSVGLRNGGVRHVAEVSTSSLEAYRFYSEGLTAFQNTRAHDAKILFEKAVAADPTFAEAYFHLALLCAQIGMPVDANRYASKAAEFADRLNERQQLLLKAELARADGNFDGAAKALDEVIAKYPDLEEAYAVACRMYQPVIGTMPNPQKHLRLLEAGLAQVPSSTLLRNLYGYALMFTGRHAEGIRAFEAYAAVAPREPNPQDSLGEAHLLVGDPQRALEHFSRALTIDPRFFPSSRGRVWALGMLGRYDEALAESSVPGFMRAFVLARVGRYREAEALLSNDIRAAQRNKSVFEEGMVRLLSVVLALERNAPPEGIDDLVADAKRFATAHPHKSRLSSVLAYTIAGLADVRAGRIDSARALLNAQRGIVNRDVAPERWWHAVLEGEIALAESDPQKAAAAFAAGQPDGKMWLHLTLTHMSMLANNLPFRDGPARAAKARGDIDGAIDVYRRLLTAGPNQTWTAMLEPRYMLEIARLEDKRANAKAALVEYRRFLDFWKKADADLPELAEAREAIARLR